MIILLKEDNGISSIGFSSSDLQMVKAYLNDKNSINVRNTLIKNILELDDATDISDEYIQQFYTKLATSSSDAYLICKVYESIKPIILNNLINLLNETNVTQADLSDIDKLKNEIEKMIKANGKGLQKDCYDKILDFVNHLIKIRLDIENINKLNEKEHILDPNTEGKSYSVPKPHVTTGLIKSILNHLPSSSHSINR